MQVGKWGTGVDTAITTMVCPDFFETVETGTPVKKDLPFTLQCTVEV